MQYDEILNNYTNVIINEYFNIQNKAKDIRSSIEQIKVDTKGIKTLKNTQIKINNLYQGKNNLDKIEEIISDVINQVENYKKDNFNKYKDNLINKLKDLSKSLIHEL